jgi:branched-chain amino acid transport system permease protein
MKNRTGKTVLKNFLVWASQKPVPMILCFFLIFPFIMPYSALATQILILGLFTLGFNILYGYTGLLHFGGAAHFGLGAYAMGILLSRYHVSIWTGLLGTITVTAVGSLIIGFLCLRRRGVYFALLNLAFAQMLYFIGFQWVSLTGGEVGLRGIPVPPLSFPGFSISITGSLRFYYFTFVFVMIALLLLKRILESPFGRVLESIRENEKRARACGYNTIRIKLLAYVISGTVSGLAGGLYALYMQFVGIEYLFYVTSGNVIIMTLLGGAGTFFGPFIGAGVFLFLADVISVYTKYWSIFLGAIFCMCVLLFPEGIWGRVKMVLGRLKDGA